MNHLQEVEFNYGEHKFILRPTQKAIYRTLKDAGLNNRFNELIKELDQVNMDVIYILFKNLADSKLSVNELLDLNIPINKLMEPVAECIKLMLVSEEGK